MAALADILKCAASRLARALKLEPREARLEVQILAAHALGVNRAWLIAHDRDELPPAAATAVDALVAKREKGEPVAYILGEKEFYGRTFRVTPDVLIPRPETELLVETALERLPPGKAASTLDVGTGSGCIAVSLALARPDDRVTGVDISPSALTIAAANAEHLGASVRLLAGDLLAPVASERFDMILSNPPYIMAADPHLSQGDLRFEPRHALASGSEGLDAISTLTRGAPSHLARGGWLLLEHGWDQASRVQTLMSESGFTNIASLRDISGHNRVTLGQWNP